MGSTWAPGDSGTTSDGRTRSDFPAGFRWGTHAPGRALLFHSFPATHDGLLAHGLATQAMCAAAPGASETSFAWYRAFLRGKR